MDDIDKAGVLWLEKAGPALREPLLSVELVPSTAWWSNVRSNVTRAEWERCKNFVRARSGERCEVCGGRGRRHPVECHEIWDYDDEFGVQTLVDLVALCPACHEVKHIGRASVVGTLERAANHLRDVNGWTDEHTEYYINVAMLAWAVRSRREWSLDVSWLSLLGIEPRVKDRG